MEFNVRWNMYLSSLQQENEEAITTCHEIRGDLKLLYPSTLNVTREDALRGSNEKTAQFKTQSYLLLSNEMALPYFDLLERSSRSPESIIVYTCLG